jgi:hypothetical protein
MKYEELTGKKLALIAWGEDENGKDDVVVFTGIARWENRHIYLDRKGKRKSFQVPDDVLERIKPVPAKIADIVLGAEFFLSMTIGSIPKDANPKDYIKTGLKWPTKK